MSLNLRFLLLGAGLMFAASAATWLVFTHLTERIVEQWGLQIAEVQVRNDTARLARPLSRDIAMALEFAEDPDLLAFAKNPQDPALEEQAYSVMEIYRRQFRDQNFFVALKENYHYYHNNAANDYADDLLRYQLNPDDAADRWFFAFLEQGLSFHLNVNPDVHLDVTKLWIDVLIGSEDQPLGVVGTGLNLDTVLGEIVDIDQDGVQTLFVDRNSAIQLHRKPEMIEYAAFVKPEGQKNTLAQLIDDPKQVEEIQTIMRDMRSNSASVEPVITRFVSVDGQRHLLGMAYMPDIGWYQMTLLDLQELMPVDRFWPVVLAFVLVLLISLTIFHWVLRSVLLNPLAGLRQAMDALRRGDFGYKDLPKAKGEVGQLTQHFSQMAKAIERNTRELEQKVAERTAELHRQARQDALTGLYNRRGLQEIMQDPEHTRPTHGVLWLDLDRFKQINDQYGHDRGDQALCTTADYLRACALPKAHIARWGGDEFLVYLEQTDQESLEAYARCLLEKVDCTENLEQPGFSIGLALGEPGESMDRLLARADKALYQAKQRGRGHYVFTAD